MSTSPPPRPATTPVHVVLTSVVPVPLIVHCGVPPFLKCTLAAIADVANAATAAMSATTKIFFLIYLLLARSADGRALRERRRPFGHFDRSIAAVPSRGTLVASPLPKRPW